MRIGADGAFEMNNLNYLNWWTVTRGGAMQDECLSECCAFFETNVKLFWLPFGQRSCPVKNQQGIKLHSGHPTSTIWTQNLLVWNTRTLQTIKHGKKVGRNSHGCLMGLCCSQNLLIKTQHSPKGHCFSPPQFQFVDSNSDSLKCSIEICQLWFPSSFFRRFGPNSLTLLF